MTLTAQHYAKLHIESAIDDEVITRRGYLSIDDPAEVQARGFSAAQAKTAPVLAIPLWNVHGEQRLWQIRPDNARPGKNGKPRKYETPYKARLILDVHPSVQPRLGDPHTPLWISEGTRKGDALVSAGAPCAIALLGVNGYRGTNEHGGKGMLPDWQHVALNGRTVYVAYDSDVATNDDVARARRVLLDWLRYRDARPVCIEWPEAYQQKKWGVDDFLADNKTLDDLLAMVPPSDPAPAAPAAVTWGTQDQQAPVTLMMNKEKRPHPVLGNVLAVLEEDDRWKGVLGYNAFSDEVVFLARPPCYEATEAWKPRALEDHDDAEIANWLHWQYELFARTTVVHEAIQTAAHRSPFHPIRDYLAKLAWDKTPRIDLWLSTYCGVEDTPYPRAVGRTTLIGAVARVQEPGCKMDTMTILKGAQGTRKSTTWNVLAGDAWFSDTLPEDLRNKDAMQNLRGKWLIEFGDLAAFHHSEIETVKRYVSARMDTYRPSYGRRTKTVLRHNIFVGTTNRDTPLKDDTGNRRFYIVTTTGICDTDALERDRDQLWAEAAHRYRQGEAWHLDPAMTVEAAAVQAEHIEIDPWTDAVLDHVEPFVGKEKVTTAQIMRDAFHWENPAMWTSTASKRIGAILREDDWRPAKKERPKEGEQPKASATRRRDAAFWKDAPISPGTDGTDGTDEESGAVPARDPHEYKANTDGTDGTDTFSHVKKETDKTQTTQNTKISPVTPYSIGEPDVPSVPSVPDRINTSANVIWPSCAICAIAHNPADICAGAAPACPHQETSLQGEGLVCLRCGAALF